MKKLIFLFVAVLLTHLLLAQSTNVPRILRWDSLYFKNEVSVDASMLFSFALGNIPMRHESFAVHYKYFFNKRNVFRTGVRVSFVRDSVDQIVGRGFRYLEPGRTDSIVLVTSRKEGVDLTLWWTLRAGYEHHIGKRRVKLILGFEVLQGVERWRDVPEITYEAILPFDTSGTLHAVTDVYIPEPEDSSFSEWFRPCECVKSYVIGFSPVIGAKFHLTNRWSLSASLLWDFYGYFTFKTPDGVGDIRKRRFTVATSTLLADISLSLHF